MLPSNAIPASEETMPGCDLMITGARMATLVEGGPAFGVIEDAALAVADGRIVWIGASQQASQFAARQTDALDGRWVTPALIDCHTHLVFAGNRAAEFEMRRQGASYEDIARAGGGIMSTVNATRAADRSSLIAEAAARLLTLKSEGCATVEIKSGYGLDVPTELRMLEVAGELGRQTGVTVARTFLGAHTVPSEFRGKADDYIDLVCNEMLPAVHEAGLADAVDAYCEPIAFTVDQVRRVFETAADLGLPVKLHADQLSDSRGAELASNFRALSADHVEYTGQSGVSALAASGTVAVLLPGAFLTLGETKRPPIEEFRAAGVSMAVATDCNPGTSPLCSLRTAMTLGCTLFGLTPEESLAGATRNAARALGLADRGTLEVGKRADLAVWDIGHPRELCYWIGTNELTDLYIAGDRQ